MLSVRPHWLVLFALSLLLSDISRPFAQACGLFHCRRCRHHHSYSNSYGMYSAPSDAPAAAAAPAVIYYAAPQQTPAGAQDFLPELKTAIDVLRLLKEVRGELTGGRISEDDASGTACNLAEVNAALKRLEEGQQDLRGRLVNIAGIQQSVGLKLVEASDRIGSIEKSTGATGDIMSELGTINRSLLDLELAEGTSRPAGTERPGSSDLKKTVDDLQEDVRGLKQQVGEIRTLLLERQKSPAKRKQRKTKTDRKETVAEPPKPSTPQQDAQEAKQKKKDGKASSEK